jgi:hypothetical protein
MAGSRTEGEKRRRKKAARNQEAWAEAEKRGRGRPPMQGIAREAVAGRRALGNPARPCAALREALLVRARLAGIAVPSTEDGKPRLTADMVRRLSQPWMGCNAGRAIETEAPELRADLWGAISDVRKTYARYWRALGLPDPHPMIARLLYAETPPDDAAPLDTAWARDRLSVEEEVKAASNAMMLCEQKLGLARWLKGCILNDEPVRDRAVLIACLRKMAS